MIPVSRTSKYIIRKLDPVYELFGPLAYPIIRIAVGVMMIPHGYGKLFNEGGIERTAKFLELIGLIFEFPLIIIVPNFLYLFCKFKIFLSISWSSINSSHVIKYVIKKTHLWVI